MVFTIIIFGTEQTMGYGTNKHGWYNPSEQASNNVNPSTDNSASGWTLNNKTFYNSDTVYYAIKKN